MSIEIPDIEYHLRQSFDRAILLASPSLSRTEEDTVKRIVDEMIAHCVVDLADLCERTVHSEVLLEIETREGKDAV